MSRIIIPIIVIAVLAAGIGTFVVFQKPAFLEIPIRDNFEQFETEDITFTLRSTNNYDLSVRSVRPILSQYKDEKFPAVLKLGGGWEEMTDMLNGELTKQAAAKGIVFAAFDSPIRVSPNSPEAFNGDYKGFKEQADVAAVLDYLINNPNVDKNIVGVWTSSSGAILASGVLGRYPELGEKVAFFIDVEGPHCGRELLADPKLDTAAIEGLKLWEAARDLKVGPGKQYAAEEEFWYERCGTNFIGNYTGMYQRIQAKQDHALGYNYLHAVAYLNAATQGKAKWSRLNGQQKNLIYKSSSEPNGIPIENVLDFEKPSEQIGWNVFLRILEEVKK